MCNKEWRKVGDQCPKCGSTETAVIVWKNNDEEIPAIGGQTRDILRPATFKMECLTCKYVSDILSEHKRGEAFS